MGKRENKNKTKNIFSDKGKKKKKAQPVFSAVARAHWQLTVGNCPFKTTVPSHAVLFFLFLFFSRRWRSRYQEEGEKKRKKKPSDASSKHTLIDVNIRPTWNRFQNRTSYWSLTDLLTVSAAWRRPLVADLSVTDCHSPAMFAAPTSSDTRCCPRKVARAIVMSSPKLFTQQTRRPCAGRKFLIFSLKQQRVVHGDFV